MSNARDDRERIESGSGEGPKGANPVRSANEEIGQMHFSTENFSTALEYFGEALKTPQLPGFPDKFRILLRISDCHRKKGNHVDAERFLDAATATAGDPMSSETLGKIEYRQAFITLFRGHYDNALKTAFSAYRRLKDSDEHSEVASIQTLLGHCYLRMGLIAEAEEFFADSLSSYRRVEDRVGIAYAYNNLGVLHKNACRWRRSLAALNKSLDLAKTIGLTQQWFSVQLNLGVVFGKLRRFPEALSSLAAALSSAERFGDQVKVTKALLAIGRTYVQTGDLARAERNLIRAQEMAAEFGYAREAALADEFLSELFMARGMYEEARSNLKRALERGRKLAPEGDIVAECLCRLAQVECRLGNSDLALRHAEEGIELAVTCEPYELGYLHRARAHCHNRIGNIEAALASAQSSVTLFGEHENPFEKAMTQRFLAKLWMKTGDEADLTRARGAITESITEFSKLEENEGQVVSQILLASIEQKLGNIDDALLAVYEADRLTEEDQNTKFRPALRALRNKIEAKMSRATTRVLDQFSVLGDIQNGARSRDQLISGLESTLLLIIERLGAHSGFVAIPKASGKSMSVVTRKGCSLKEAQAIESWYSNQSRESVKSGLVITDLENKTDAAGLRDALKDPTGTLLLQGLGFDGDALGVLCVQQTVDQTRGPLGQDAMHFVAAYSSLISLSIYELVRNERKGRQKTRPSGAKGFESIVTDNKEMIKLLNLAERVAHSDATVLLQGETGTGKGLIAYAVHLLSERRERSFIHVNCAALPEQLLESELFGHVRGAFTGAFADKEGLLLQASGGTIFLDEIGKTSLAMQGKLLQFLDTNKVRKVGSNDLLPVDVRVVCASKANLLQMCEDGRFLEDFFYRINDFPLTVPPLRERREDIPLLMYHYMDKIAREMDKAIEGASDDFVDRLKCYHWPGNVRELEKIIKRAVILADDGDVLDMEHLAPELTRPTVSADLDSEVATLRERIQQIEYDEILEALRRHAGNKSQAAIQLGISYPNLLSKIKRYNIQ